MKVSKTSRRRVYLKGLILSESEVQRAKMLFGSVDNLKKQVTDSKKTVDQRTVFRSNIGKFIASERDETASAVGATKRDSAAIVRKYQSVKG